MTEARKIESLSIKAIVVPAGRRHVQEDKVAELAHSIELTGLQQPIKVRMQADEPHLIDGLHRLSAARALGWPDIDSEVVEADDRRARMIEIAANLHRAELNELERAEAITEWVRLAEEERKLISAQLAQKLGPGRPEGGQSQAARELGAPRDAVRRAQKIAALPEGAKAAARDLHLANNQAALLRAAKSEDPLAALQEHASRSRHVPEAVTIRRAMQADALDRVATMLIERLGDEIAEIVLDLEAITTAALVKVLRERCPDLPDTGHNDGFAGEQPEQALPSEDLRKAEEPSEVRQLPKTKIADAAKALTAPQRAVETAAEPSRTSAEELIEIVRGLGVNTQLRAVRWVECGCPDPEQWDDNIRTRESLTRFRNAASQASKAELDRFLELSLAEGWRRPMPQAA